MAAESSTGVAKLDPDDNQAAFRQLVAPAHVARLGGAENHTSAAMEMHEAGKRSIVAAVVCLVALGLLLGRTSIGLHMRAAALDFQTARLLGVNANRVIMTAVLISGALAAVVSVMLTVQNSQVTSGFALYDTIVVLAGVVVGGMNRLVSATLGGFAIGFASGFLGAALSTNQSQYTTSFVFGLVVIVLLVRPAGLFARGGSVERL